jgi:hypothetical protein
LRPLLLVLRLFLPVFIADDTLIPVAGRRRSFRCLFELLPTFPDQQFVAEHLPNNLFGLGLGLVVEFAHDGLLAEENGISPPMFPAKFS